MMFSIPIWVQKNNFLIENKKENDSYLSDLFDFWASFANQWATLAPWENQAECHRWLACHVAVCHCCANILRESSKICFSALTVRKSALFYKSFFLCVCVRLWKRCIQCPSAFTQNFHRILNFCVKRENFVDDVWKIAYSLCFTSSNFCAIMEKALKMPSVGPVMVTILSGDDPSDMFIRAPLWKPNVQLLRPQFAKVATQKLHVVTLKILRWCSPPPSFSSLFLLS